MKKQYTLFFFSFLIIGSLCAQKFTGIATYKTDRKIPIEVDTMKVKSELEGVIRSQILAQFRKEYELTFTLTESLYKEVPKLGAPMPSAGGIHIGVSGTGDVLYRNVLQQQFVNETTIMGKPFLVIDSIQKPTWQLENETKFIGEYRCMKATYTREVTEKTFNSENDSLVEVKKDRVTTAWYTMDIPVPHGPDTYWGLPGLILEISEGDLTILCSKIVLNSEKGVDVVAPKKGKEVSQAEFDEIREKKTQEMMERFQGDGRRQGNNQSIQIKIGGQ